MANYTYEGKEEQRKTVGKQGSGGCGVIYVPRTWIGYNVAVVLLSGKDAEKEDSHKDPVLKDKPSGVNPQAGHDE